MNGVLAVYQKELWHYFRSPIAYYVVAVFLVGTGYFYTYNVFLSNTATMDATFQNMGILLTVVAPRARMLNTSGLKLPWGFSVKTKYKETLSRRSGSTQTRLRVKKDEQFPDLSLLVSGKRGISAFRYRKIEPDESFTQFDVGRRCAGGDTCGIGSRRHGFLHRSSGV